MAWRRTVLAVAVVSLLTGRLAVERGPTGVVAVTPALAALGWLTVLAVGHRRIGELARRPERIAAPLLWLVAAVCLGYVAIGMLLALFA